MGDVDADRSQPPCVRGVRGERWVAEHERVDLVVERDAGVGELDGDERVERRDLRLDVGMDATVRVPREPAGRRVRLDLLSDPEVDGVPHKRAREGEHS